VVLHSFILSTYRKLRSIPDKAAEQSVELMERTLPYLPETHFNEDIEVKNSAYCSVDETE
jgi:hypothetical protein